MEDRSQSRCRSHTCHSLQWTWWSLSSRCWNRCAVKEDVLLIWYVGEHLHVSLLWLTTTLPNHFSFCPLGRAPVAPCPWEQTICFGELWDVGLMSTKDQDWPACCSWHGLVQKGFSTVLITDSFWEAGQGGVKLPQDVCTPSITIKYGDIELIDGVLLINYGHIWILCHVMSDNVKRQRMMDRQTYLAAWSRKRCFYHLRCWKQQKNRVSFNNEILIRPLLPKHQLILPPRQSTVLVEH